jgi:hypothetical protein
MWLYILLGIAGQLIMWPVAARVHYRTWSYDSWTSDEDRQLTSAFWGFLWPALVLAVIVYCLYIGVEHVMTYPSRAEAREALLKARKEARAALDKQIAAAEAELEQTQE